MGPGLRSSPGGAVERPSRWWGRSSNLVWARSVVRLTTDLKSRWWGRSSNLVWARSVVRLTTDLKSRWWGRSSPRLPSPSHVSYVTLLHLNIGFFDPHYNGARRWFCDDYYKPYLMNRLFSREVYVYATRGSHSISLWNRPVFKMIPSLSEGRGATV